MAPTADRRLLVNGVIDADGRRHATPHVVLRDADGTITNHYPLQGHEPHSTVAVNALLDLSTLTLCDP